MLSMENYFWDLVSYWICTEKMYIYGLVLDKSGKGNMVSRDELHMSFDIFWHIIDHPEWLYAFKCMMSVCCYCR